ncbi:hypothetical protein GOODEAATRI_011319, partial [Goodea atripinnis]
VIDRQELKYGVRLLFCIRRSNYSRFSFSEQLYPLCPPLHQFRCTLPVSLLTFTYRAHFFPTLMVVSQLENDTEGLPYSMSRVLSAFLTRVSYPRGGGNQQGKRQLLQHLPLSLPASRLK